MSSLQLPVLLRALGDEVRLLQQYHDRGLITQEEADERLADWDLFYPPGWGDIAQLADARRAQPLPEGQRNVQPWTYAEAAE